MERLVVAITGASGMLAAKLLVKKSPWPVSLVASPWGRDVYQRECGSYDNLLSLAHEQFDNENLGACISSGSVSTRGMVVMPCSSNTLGQIAGGLGSSLVTRAAHVHLKERRPLILGVREMPWSLIDLENAAKVTAAGAIIAPLSPPFFMTMDRDPDTVTMTELVSLYIDRVLALLGKAPDQTWETLV